MNRSTSRRDFVIALLVAVWAHVGLFFFFVVLLIFDLIAAKVIPPEVKKEKEEPIRMQMVYAEDEVVAEVGGEPVPLEEAAAPEEEEMESPPAFVQTREDQETEEAPDETPLIGERNTAATSDAGAVAGEEQMAALAGEEERKNDPKTFDSSFSEGDTSGPVEGHQESLEAGQGEDMVTEEMSAATGQETAPQEIPTPEREEELPKPEENDLASIDEALAALDEAIGEEPKEMPQPPVEKAEEMPPGKPAEKAQEAANQDGGFAPKSRKTRVAGVMSANGQGSLDVADTPTGRYQAGIFKKLETAWQMENIRNRSLLAPGNVTLYFVVDKKGRVSRQRQVAMVGASGTQWGMILRALNGINIPKMPGSVVKELDGEPLELIVTFNY